MEPVGRWRDGEWPGPNDGWIAKDTEQDRAAAVMDDASGIWPSGRRWSDERGRRAHWASDEYTGGLGGGRCN